MDFTPTTQRRSAFQEIRIVIGLPQPTFRTPMLAPTRIPHPHQVRFPVLASEKINGVRNLVFPGFGCRSRTIGCWLAPGLPARMAAVIAAADASGHILEGEFWHPRMGPRELQALLNAADSDEPALAGLRFLAWDAIPAAEFEGNPRTPFAARNAAARCLLDGMEGVSVLAQREIDTWEKLLDAYRAVRAAGGEGLMIRRADGLYRGGRRSLADADLMKIRPVHLNSRQTDIPSGLEV